MGMGATGSTIRLLDRGRDMSSVQDFEKCPQCGGIYVKDFECGSFEEYRYCNRCGKRESFTGVWDEQGNAVLDEDGKLQFNHSESFGWGCFAIAGRNGVTAICNLTVPVDDMIRKDYLEAMKEPEVDSSKSYLTSWDNQKQEITAVFGTLPSSYDDFLCDEDGEEAETS